MGYPREKVKFAPPLPELSREAMVGLDDLFFFGSEIWGLDLLREKPHRQMADDLMGIYFGTSGKDYLLNCVPRDCFKTTFGSVCYAAWVQLNEIYRNHNYYYRIFFNGATKEKSWALIEKLTQKFEYDGKLQLFYGNLKGRKVGVGQFSGYDLSPKYTEKEISVIAEPNFFCGSEVSEQTGKHSDMNIHDDLSEQKNSTTVKRRQKVIESYKNGYSILRKDGGKQVMNCTSWHDADVKGYIYNTEMRVIEEQGPEATRWVLRNFGAVLEDGTLYFPERLSLEVLAQLKHSLGPYIFGCQYMNDPSSVGKLVTEDQIRWRASNAFPEIKKIRITVDPAYGDEERENGDYYWISVGGFDQFNTLYLLDVRFGTDWGPSGLVDRLFELSVEYGRNRGITPQIFFEADHAPVFRELIGYQEAKRGVDLRVKFIARERAMDKWSRWVKLQPRFENGRIFFSEDIPLASQAEIKEQLLRAPNGAHDDFLDTLADMETGITMKTDVAAATDGAASEHVESLIPKRPVMKMVSYFDHTTRRYVGKMVPIDTTVEVVNFEALMK